MNIQQKIDVLKKLSPSDVNAFKAKAPEGYSNLELLRKYTDNFSDLTIINQVKSIETDNLDKVLSLLKIYNIGNASKKASTPSKPAKAKPAKAPKAKKEKPAKAPKAPKAKKEKPVKASKGESQVVKLKAEVEKLRKEVLANAKFKNKVGDELTAFLKKNPVTLGATPSQAELENLKNKIKFYKNLLKGDVADFKAIAQRVGIEPRKLKLPKKSNFSKAFPNAKAKPMYNDGTPLSGLGKKKSRKT